MRGSSSRIPGSGARTTQGEGLQALAATGLWKALEGQHLELGRPGWESGFTIPWLGGLEEEIHLSDPISTSVKRGLNYPHPAGVLP